MAEFERLSIASDPNVQELFRRYQGNTPMALQWRPDQVQEGWSPPAFFLWSAQLKVRFRGEEEHTRYIVAETREQLADTVTNEINELFDQELDVMYVAIVPVEQASNRTEVTPTYYGAEINAKLYWGDSETILYGLVENLTAVLERLLMLPDSSYLITTAHMHKLTNFR
jgi:hypothetical protein